MDIQEVKEISKMLPKFVQMVENELGEDEHNIKGELLTYADFEKIESLAIKLRNCLNFVDTTIFK